MIESEKKRQLTMDYIAQHLFYMTKAVYAIGGGDFKGKSYVELAYPGIASSDTRSAEEIKAYILKRLSE